VPFRCRLTGHFDETFIRTFFRERGITLGGDPPMVEAYCVKCKAKKQMANPISATMANGRPCVKGSCPDCKTGMFRIGAAK